MYLYKYLLVLVFFVNLEAKVLEIDENTKKYDLLVHSSIHIDHSKNLKINNILNEDISFKENSQSLLSYGYSPDFNIIIKFELHNISDTKIQRVVEYDNPLTTDIVFYNPNKHYLAQRDGIFHINTDRKTVNPTFNISLEAFEKKVYYMKASSQITTLIVKLNLWQYDSFYEKEIAHQLKLALFFGAMMILALYNLFIYLFTRDKSYLYYVVYMVSITFHHLLYVGFANIYTFSPELNELIIRFASFIVGIPAMALALFTKSFLKTKQYPVLNKVLNVYLILFPFLLSIFIITDYFNVYRNIFSVLLLLFLIIFTIYAAYKKNSQATFILFGWFVFITAGTFMYLSSAGIFSIYKMFPYYVEVSLIFEAMIFSVALANRIKKLQLDKEETHIKLLNQQDNEQKKLKEKVLLKTNDLTLALNEKDLLLKELNHRVKNNMQTIVSLVRLQCDETEDDTLKDAFITIQNRINAMSHLHELLYKQDDILNIDAYEYFTNIIEEVQYSYNNTAVVEYNITTELEMEHALYCGLILNELITNSCKYAFDGLDDKIRIGLRRENKTNIFSISDNGKGYDNEVSRDSLGLTLVNALAENQLNGNIVINAKDGVDIKISWSI